MSWAVEWFYAHQTEIITFLTSSTFVTMLTFLYNLIHGNKLTKENTNTTGELRNALVAVNGTKESIDDNTTVVKGLNDKLNTLIELDTALLDILNLAFSRSKDEAVRTGVSNIYMSMTHKKDEVVASLQEEISELKNTIKAYSKTAIIKESAETETVAVDDVVTRG